MQHRERWGSVEKEACVLGPRAWAAAWRERAGWEGRSRGSGPRGCKARLGLRGEEPQVINLRVRFYFLWLRSANGESLKLGQIIPVRLNILHFAAV